MDLFDLARRSWPWVLVRGILVLLFGLAVLVWPEKSLAVLAIVFGVYALIDGVGSIVSALMARGVDAGQRWLIGLFGGLLALFGLSAIIRPELTVLAFAFLLGFWALVFGVERIIHAFQLRHGVRGWGWVLASGVLTVLAGLVLVFWPGIAVATLAVVIGVGALLTGLAMIASGLMVRAAVKHADGGAAAPVSEDRDR